MLGTSAFGIEEVCRMRAEQSSQTKALAAEADELERTWSTTGFYTWQEMARMIEAVGNLTRSVSSASIEQGARYTTSGLQKARNDYFDVQKRALDYNEDWKRARQTDAILDSPGFKRWIISVLRAANKLMFETEVAACQEPWWLAALGSYVVAFLHVAGIAKTIGKTVVSIGKTVLKTGDALLSAWPVIKWGAIGFAVLAAGVFAYNKLAATAEAGRKPIDWDRAWQRLFPKRGE